MKEWYKFQIQKLQDDFFFLSLTIIFGSHFKLSFFSPHSGHDSAVLICIGLALCIQATEKWFKYKMVKYFIDLLWPSPSLYCQFLFTPFDGEGDSWHGMVEIVPGFCTLPSPLWPAPLGFGFAISCSTEKASCSLWRYTCTIKSSYWVEKFVQWNQNASGKVTGTWESYWYLQ